MTAAAAVVLLLNGVQIWMPQPAVVLEGTAWVPVRAVCAPRGVVVTMTGAAGHKRLVLDVGGRSATFPLSPTPAPDRALLLGGTAYLPARTLATALHGVWRWDAAARTLHLWLPWGGNGPELAQTADLVRDGLAWRDHQVELTGRLAGRWRADRPLGDDGFALRAGGVEISCATQEFSQAIPTPSPLSQIGQSARVTGTVVLDPAGLPVVKTLAVAAPDARSPLTLWVSADRAVVEAGTQIWMEWRLANPTNRPVPLPSETAQVTLEISSPGLTGLRQELDLGPRATLRGPAIPPGFDVRGAVEWRAPAGVAGEYRARLRMGAWPPAESAFRVILPAPAPRGQPVTRP